MALYDDVMNEFSTPKNNKPQPTNMEERQEGTEQVSAEYSYVTEQLVNEMDNGQTHPAEKVEKPKKESKKKGDGDKQSDSFWTPSQLVMSLIFLAFVGLFVFIVSVGVSFCFKSLTGNEVYNNMMELFK